jgi:hypothetical protein
VTQEQDQEKMEREENEEGEIKREILQR